MFILQTVKKFKVNAGDALIGCKPVPCNLNHSNSGNQPNKNTCLGIIEVYLGSLPILCIVD